MQRRKNRKYAKRARAIGRAAAVGWGTTTKGGATGAILDVAINEAAKRSTMVAAHPIASSLVVLGAGHFAKRKWPTVGAAMCGAAGVLLSQGVRASGGLSALVPGSGETQGVLSPARVRQMAAQAGADAARRELNAGMAGNVQAEAAGVVHQFRR